MPALLAIGALLAWRLRRGRILFALLILLLTNLALDQLMPGQFSPEGRVGLDQATAGTALGIAGPLPRLSPALLLLALLLPLNFVGLTLLGERGVFTRSGAVRLGLIFGQVLAILGAGHLELERINALLTYPLTPANFTTWTALTDPVLLAFALSFILATLRLSIRPDPVTRGLLWTLPVLFLALDAAVRGESYILQLVTGAVILIVSTIESSFAMAYRDGLTGLPSRRAFNEEILRVGGSYTIAMVDIDHFKRCNDRYGHDVGDQVLRMVAARLGSVGGSGKTFRYGGEEFAVLFAGKRRTDCMPHLEELRKVIGNTAFNLRDARRPRRKPKSSRTRRTSTRSIKITISIGVAERSLRHNEPLQVIKAADKALYRAKRGGRNRVMA